MAISDPGPAGPQSAGGGPAFRSWETAVSTCEGAKGFEIRMLLGTPSYGQSLPSLPVM